MKDYKLFPYSKLGHSKIKSKKLTKKQLHKLDKEEKRIMKELDEELYCGPYLDPESESDGQFDPDYTEY